MLDAFEAHRPKLDQLGAELRHQLEAKLRDAGIPVHFVGWRLKSAESLAHKLARPDKSYRRLWDVTDLIGLRVVTYFEDHVEAVARLIERDYQVDYAHSARKLQPEGYRSVHYVCGHAAIDDAFRFEVQLRTVLQHAWAEVEHDLGYKVSDAVPEAIRRRFARVAGLLEIADQEFVSIRSDLVASRAAVRAALQEKGELPIDLVSLEALVRQPLLEAIDRQIATTLDRPLSDAPFFPGYLVDVLRLCGLETSVQVLGAVGRHGGAVTAALTPYFEALAFDARSIPTVDRGYGLLVVAHLAVVRGEDLGLSKVARLTRLYEQLEYPGDEATAHRVASGLVKALT